MQPSNYVLKGEFKRRNGSSSMPHAGGHRIIINLCNDSGDVWEKTAATYPVEKRWPKCGQEYRRWYLSQYHFKLGEVQEVNVQSDTCLANVIVFQADGSLDEEALTKAIDRIGEMAYDYNSSVHIQQTQPWDKIEGALIEKIIKRGKNVTVYVE